MDHTHEHHHHHDHSHHGAEAMPAVAKIEQQSVVAKPGEVIYTCPMHPQIRQVGPATAPSAAWPWSRWRRQRLRARIPSSSNDAALLGWLALAVPLGSDCDGRNDSASRRRGIDRWAATIGLPH